MTTFDLWLYVCVCLRARVCASSSPRAECQRSSPAGLPSPRTKDPQSVDEVLGPGRLRETALRSVIFSAVTAILSHMDILLISHIVWSYSYQHKLLCLTPHLICVYHLLPFSESEQSLMELITVVCTEHVFIAKENTISTQRNVIGEKPLSLYCFLSTVWCIALHRMMHH